MVLANPPTAANKAASSDAALVLAAPDAQFLAQVGMLAAARADVAAATSIFGALRLLRPQRAYPLVGLAVAHLNAARAPEAVSLLAPVQLEDPAEQAQVLAWLGLALRLAGHQARSLRVLSAASRLSGAGAELARQLLEDGQTSLKMPLHR